MNKLSKKTYFLIITFIAISIYLVAINAYRKPIAVHKTFNNVTLFKAGTSTIVKAETNAKLYRGIYGGSIFNFNLHFTDRIEGNIIIDGKEYTFHGFNGESKPVNLIGSVYDKNQNTSSAFLFKMNDLDSLELVSTNNPVKKLN